MEEIRQDLDELTAITQRQSEMVGALVGGLELMNTQIQDRPTKKGVQRLVAVVAGAIVALMVTFSALAFVSSNEALNEIKSCTTPSGECAQRGQEGQTQAIGQIVCNQEKIVYMIDAEYTPFPYCVQFINNEIERTHLDVPKLPVPDDVPQIVLDDTPRDS
jgi:hypothetical protein